MDASWQKLQRSDTLVLPRHMTLSISVENSKTCVGKGRSEWILYIWRMATCDDGEWSHGIMVVLVLGRSKA